MNDIVQQLCALSGQVGRCDVSWWLRLKLLWAESLVVSTMKGDHTETYKSFAWDAVDAIREYREMYYSEPQP